LAFFFVILIVIFSC